jgi:hypothetical protein
MTTKTKRAIAHILWQHHFQMYYNYWEFQLSKKSTFIKAMMNKPLKFLHHKLSLCNIYKVMKMCSWDKWRCELFFSLYDYPMHCYWGKFYHWNVICETLSDTDYDWDMECWTDNTFYLLHNYYDKEDKIINC